MTPHPALVRGPAELCQLARDWRGGLPDHGTMAEEKVDGVRACWIDGRLLTREGMEIGGVGHIAWRIEQAERAEGRKLFVDGEFVAPGGFRETLRHIGQGLRAPEQGTLHAFDCLYLDEWRENDCDRPLVERKAMLTRIVETTKGLSGQWEWRPGTHGREPDGPAIEVIPDRWCFDRRDVEAMAAEIWARDGEGVMLKDAETPYRRDRNASWQKYKRAGWSTRKIV